MTKKLKNNVDMARYRDYGFNFCFLSKNKINFLNSKTVIALQTNALCFNFPRFHQLAANDLFCFKTFLPFAANYTMKCSTPEKSPILFELNLIFINK